MTPSKLTGIVVALGLGAGCSALDPAFGDLAAPAPAVDAGAAADGGPVSFALDIRPLMNRSATDPTGHGCKACHYATQPEHVGLDLGGLDLTTLGTLRLGGATSGAKVVIPGDPADSVIVQKLLGTYYFGARMPRDGPAYWSADEIAIMEQWISEGAMGADDE